MDRKVVNNFVVRVLVPPRIPSQQLIRWSGTVVCTSCTCRNTTHGCINFRPRRLICTIFINLIGNLCMCMHAPKKKLRFKIRDLIISAAPLRYIACTCTFARPTASAACTQILYRRYRTKQFGDSGAPGLQLYHPSSDGCTVIAWKCISAAEWYIITRGAAYHVERHIDICMWPYLFSWVFGKPIFSRRHNDDKVLVWIVNPRINSILSCSLGDSSQLGTRSVACTCITWMEL